MEVKFTNKPLQCLQPFYGQIHTQEQTQEIRLPDAYPDIGKVLGCWGQVLMRGKEWRSTSMGANGGVMVWVMYAPEDGTQPRVLDAWLPITCRWEFPEQADDGIMILRPMLSSLDCRGISARKIMVRASLDTFAQALKKKSMEIPVPGELPEDVQLLTKSYPAELPVEAGEKQVQLEETISFPGNLPAVQKIISYEMMPMITEQKVLGNRLVFRGEVGIQMSYLTPDGAIGQWKTEIPFSQFTELEGDYDSGASAWVMPILTAMEMELTEDQQLHLRAGIAAQYIIFDRTMLDVVEDAYSPKRDLVPKMEQMQLPALLDNTAIELQVDGTLKGDVDRIEMLCMTGEYPVVHMDEGTAELHMDGQFQTLYRDGENMLAGDNIRFESTTPFSTAAENQIQLWPGFPVGTEYVPGTDGMALRSMYPMTVQVYSGQSIPMVTELEMGELKEADPSRPSIILRRAGDEGLWAMAKDYGSTVQAIREANQLTDEPLSGQMLLIPVS